LTAINRWVSHHIVKASATQNVDGEHVGVLNKVFAWLYEIHLVGRRIKEWNRKVYYALKYYPDPCYFRPPHRIRFQVMGREALARRRAVFLDVSFQ